MKTKSTLSDGIADAQKRAAKLVLADKRKAERKERTRKSKKKRGIISWIKNNI